MYFTCSAPINVLISKSFHIFVIFGHNDFPAFDLEIRFYSSVFQFFTLNFLYFIVSQKIDIFLAKIDRFYQKIKVLWLALSISKKCSDGKSFKIKFWIEIKIFLMKNLVFERAGRRVDWIFFGRSKQSFFGGGEKMESPYSSLACPLLFLSSLISRT